MDVERSLVSAIVQTQSIESVLSRSIEPHHFHQRAKGDTSPVPMPGEVYSWILQHVRAYRAVPSLELARARFPRFEFIYETNPVEAVLDQMIKTVNRRELIQGIRQLSELADDWDRLGDVVPPAQEVVSDLLKALPSTEVTRFSDSINRLELNKLMSATGIAPGISLVLKDLDHLTYGIQGHEMAVILGFLGQGKSTLGVQMSADAYFERGVSPLFFSFEMEGGKLAARWDAYAARIPYRAMKRGQLKPEEYDKWMRVAEKAAQSKFEKDIIVIDSERRPTSDFIHGQIEKWRPGMSVVDTLDEVRAPAHIKGHWETQDYIARELKGVARHTKRPLVAIAQAGRAAADEGATLDNVAGSITIARKADIAIGLHATPEMKRNKMVEFRLLKNRDDEGEGWHQTFYWDKGTGEIRPWTHHDSYPSKPQPQMSQAQADA